MRINGKESGVGALIRRLHSYFLRTGDSLRSGGGRNVAVDALLSGTHIRLARYATVDTIVSVLGAMEPVGHWKRRCFLVAMPTKNKPQIGKTLFGARCFADKTRN